MQPCKQTLLLQDTLALVDRNRVPRIAYYSGKGNNYGVSWGCVINKAHFVEENAPDFYITNRINSDGELVLLREREVQ